MVGPSKTTQPFGIGSPRPGMRRSASMRPMLEGKAFDGMRILLLRTVRREGNPFGAGPTPPPPQLRTSRSPPPRTRKSPVGDPSVSAGPPTDEGSKAGGHVLRDRGDGRERDARRLRTGTPGPSSGRVLPRPGRRRADERGRN